MATKCITTIFVLLHKRVVYGCIFFLFIGASAWQYNAYYEECYDMLYTFSGVEWLKLHMQFNIIFKAHILCVYIYIYTSVFFYPDMAATLGFKIRALLSTH